METKIISIISGKGGTGKSLFTAVLGNCLSKEKCRVLIVDMDIHVRGLTILLSKYIGVKEGISVTDCLEGKDCNYGFAVYRFQECEILPAVFDITQPLNKDIRSSSIDTFMIKLYDFAQEKKYDIVLLDCRSGLDDWLIKIARKSDFFITVSEDDDVCLQSTYNLINHLKYNEGINDIYTVINKGRRVNKKSDIETKLKEYPGINCIGVMPFDETIMEDYGKDRFWLTVYDTLYFYGIVKFWNIFREKASITYSISEDRYFFGKGKNMGNSMSKVFRLYGFIAVVTGVFFPIFSNIADVYVERAYVLSSFLSIIGLLMLILSSRKFRSFLLGQDDEPKKKW